MSDDTIVLPENYKLLSGLLKPVINDIQNAFLNRPVPEGSPFESLHEAIQPIAEDLSQIITELTETLNNIPGCTAIEEDNTSRQAVIEAANIINESIQSIISIYNHVWIRPFPVKFESGQILASAGIEEILRECLSFFKKIVDIVERPEEIFAIYGSYTVDMKLTLKGQALQDFSEWLHEQQSPKYSTNSADERNKNLFLGFLFGWWIGHKD